MPPAELRYSQFLKKLKQFGVVETRSRGKGSERYLIRPNHPGLLKGPPYTIRCHEQGDRVKTGTMAACLRRLNIDSNEFWR